MELWQLLLITGIILATLIAFVWLALRITALGKSSTQPRNIAGEAVNESIKQAFTDDFGEELRQRARQQFEKLIQENAMYLQQDVRVSATQLNDLMKKEVVDTLKSELNKYHQTIMQTQQMLSDSVAKSQSELRHQLNQEKDRRIELLDERLATIVKKYILASVGDVITTDQQIALVIDSLNSHKANIVEDIRNA